MKWPKRLIVTGVAMLTAAAALTLTACSKNSDSSNDGKVTIEYFNQKTEMVDTLKEIIKDFEKENPKIHVKMTSVPSAGTVLKTRMLAGDAPDVINIYPQNVDFKEWAKAGYFENMTGKSYLENIKNHYEKNYAVNGKIYSVPLSANVSGIYFNKTKFEELGLKVPETWDEFETLVKQIKTDGETPFALAGSEGWTLNGYHQLAYISVTGSGDKANDYLRNRNCPVKNDIGCFECDKHGRLTDRKGMEFPVMCSDFPCVEMLNCHPLYMLDRLDEVKTDFIHFYFSIESKKQVEKVIALYENRGKPDFKYTRGLYQRGTL